MTNLERFKDKIVENFEGCWVWLGQVNHGGYGLFWADDALHAAHKQAVRQWRANLAGNK